MLKCNAKTSRSLQSNYCLFFTLYVSELLQNDEEKNLFCHTLSNLTLHVCTCTFTVCTIVMGPLIPNIKEINLL